MDSMDIDISEADFVHEEEILRNPHSVKCWLRYIEHKQDGLPMHLNMVYERALKQLPGSYKLWYKYLRERRRQCKENIQKFEFFTLHTIGTNYSQIRSKLDQSRPNWP